MKTLKIFFVTVLLMAMFVSCKKDNVEKPDCHIIGIGTEYVLQHDAQGRLQSVTHNANFITNFTYAGNTITAISTQNGGVFFSKEIYNINDNGLVSQSRREYNIAGTDWQERVYQYSGTQLMSATVTESSGNVATRTYTWSNGNMVREYISNSTGSTQQIDYEFYTNKPYQQGDIGYWDKTVNGIEIVRSKNMLKKRTSVYTENNISGTEIESYSYDFDGNGKITSVTISSGTNSDTYTYQYQCN